MIIITWLAYIWSALISFLFAPVYIHMLGVAQYGLVGLYITILNLSCLFDLGLSQTYTREVARLGENHQSSNLADLHATLERVIWGIGALLLIAALLWCNLQGAATYQDSAVSLQTWRNSLYLMVIAVMVRWPVALYCGGLLGLRKMPQYAGFTAVSATFRVVGAIAALAYWGKTVEVFLGWQIAVGIMQTIWSRQALLRYLPGASSGRFSADLLAKCWRYTSSVTLVLVLSILFLNIDKLILARILSLTDYGYYSFAVSVAAALMTLTVPIVIAIQPGVIAAHAASNLAELSKQIFKGQFYLGLILFPAAMILFQYMQTILILWTRHQDLALHTAAILSWYLPGQVCLVLANYWLNLQIGCAAVKVALSAYLIAIVFITTGIILFLPAGGVLMAAQLWCGANIGLLLIAFLGLRQLIPWKNMLVLVTRYLLLPVVLIAILLIIINQFAPSELHILQWLPFLLCVTAIVVGSVFAVNMALKSKFGTEV